MIQHVKRQRRVARAALVLTAFAGASSAYADPNQCGAPVGANPATATCTTAGNPYPTDITYVLGAGDLLVNIDPGVVVDLTVLGPRSAIGAEATAGAATVIAPNVTIDATNDPAANDRHGITVRSGGMGDATVNAAGSIAVAGGNFNFGVFAIANGDGNADITWSGPISVSGSGTAGLYADANGAGSATIDASGDITGVLGATGQVIGGIFAAPEGDGDSLIHYRAGTINMTGKFAYGLLASNYGLAGSSTVITDPGTSIVVNGAPDGTQNGSAAVQAVTYSGNGGIGNFVLADIASRIENTGGVTPHAIAEFNPIGISARAANDAHVTVLYSGPGITTSGGGGIGISAFSASGNVTINSSGPITTDGEIAHGIFVDSGELPSFGLPVFEFPIQAPIFEVPQLPPSGVGGAIDITSSAAISTVGFEAHGIVANSLTGPVTVTAADTTTDGEFSIGVLATAGDVVAVNVLPGGEVRGGWQGDPAAVSTRFFVPSAGVVLGSRTIEAATLNNEGTIGALSDRAVTEVELFRDGFVTQDLTINNDGTIIGYVTLGAGDAIFNNTSPNSLDLRNFSDTDGDGVRDTKAVAVSDFGAGVDLFNNEATGAVKLLTVIGATTVDTTGQILPDGFGVHDSAQPGVEQGQIINLERFENRGLITLQDEFTGGGSPIAGDVLVITGSDTPGVSGSGVFLSDGGAFHIDTVLNEGDAASISDILVLDTTQVGPGGATRVSVVNAGGLGAPTPGDGIKVVDVLESLNSAADAFALEGRAVGGAFEYFLFQGGRTDPADGDWYLRSQPVVPPEPPPGPPVFRPEVPAYLANMRAATGMFLHTLHERLGEPQFAEDARPSDGRALDSYWLRTVGRYTDIDPHGAFPFDASTNTWLVQGGIDFIDWSLAGTVDRLHLGGMFGYGESNSDTRALDNPNRAKADANGYSFGAYGTWYSNDQNRMGLYVDGWLQAGVFDNKVAGDFLPVVDYDTNAYTGSLETGYAFKVGSEWPVVFEPQAQLVYVSFDQDDLIEPNTTLVSASGDTWISRLGARAMGTWISGETKYQPYLELNWWHDFDEASLTMNALTFQAGAPEDRGEIGAGVNVEIAPKTTLWANAEYQFGSNYEGVEGMVGVKYAW